MSRYHSQVIWGPFVLALVFGAIVAAAVYAAYRWPEAEPLSDPAVRVDETAPSPAATEPSAKADVGD